MSPYVIEIENKFTSDHSRAVIPKVLQVNRGFDEF